mmetsp:Transcript_45314/g.45719  ORF Transcript_45314/g.45719 Transcript_45314/m.45719 type:complete len:223 (+) Transcript_45314:72-740(+)
MPSVADTTINSFLAHVCVPSASTLHSSSNFDRSITSTAGSGMTPVNCQSPMLRLMAKPFRPFLAITRGVPPLPGIFTLPPAFSTRSFSSGRSGLCSAVMYSRFVDSLDPLPVVTDAKKVRESPAFAKYSFSPRRRTMEHVEPPSPLLGASISIWRKDSSRMVRTCASVRGAFESNKFSSVVNFWDRRAGRWVAVCCETNSPVFPCPSKVPTRKSVEPAESPW